MEIKTSFKKTGMLNITFVAQNLDDEKLLREAENSVEPIAINSTIFSFMEKEKREMWVLMTIGDS
jgi:hypothetical protein